MKAWRKEAAKINKQRKAELAEYGVPITPTARQQMRARVQVPAGIGFLLAGLLIHAGITPRVSADGAQP